MKHHHFLPFFIILVVSYVGLHLYIARWLARAFELGPVAAQWTRIALLLAAFLSPFSMFLRRHFESPALDVVYNAAYAWMGVVLVAWSVLLAFQLAWPLLRRLPLTQPQLAWGALAVLGAVLAWSFHAAWRTPQVREVTVEMKGLPPSLEGLRIAQISDMHVDSEWKLHQYAEVVDAINAHKPDLVLITGDLIDPGLTCRERMGGITARLNARLGVYGALGNHEYYYGLDQAMGCYKDFGIKLLKNASADIGDIRLTGTGDIHTEGLEAADVARLLDGNKGKFSIVMTHQPLYYKELAAAGARLVFSGHTHRGQIFPFNLPTMVFYPYFYGLYRIGDAAFYVSSGTGTWGPPLRWLAPAEIPVITLKNAK